MTEQTVTTVTRPTHVEGERVLMFVRLTAVLNERDAMNDKRRITKFVNDLDSAKEEARTLTTTRNLGYIWMTQRYDTLNADGTINREEHNFQWTRTRQWVKRDTNVFTVEVKPEEATPEADPNSPF
jgi:hypothetical protein